jgi:hypothetical protein
MCGIGALGRDSEQQDRTKAQLDNAVPQLIEHGANHTIDQRAIVQG